MMVFSGWGGRSLMTALSRYGAGVCLSIFFAVVPHASVGAERPAAPVSATPAERVARDPASLSPGAPVSGEQQEPVKKEAPFFAPSPSGPADEKNAASLAPGVLPVPGSAAKTAAGGTAGTKAAPARFPVSCVPEPSAVAADAAVPESWRPLATRLAADGVEEESLRRLFGRLGDSYSHVPMGKKVNELFLLKYLPKPPRPPKEGPPAAPLVYKSMLTPERVARCRAYLSLHGGSFAAAEKEYGVPKEFVAALLMVETQLGAFLGASSAFWSLACMAAADAPERISPTLQELPLPVTEEKRLWLTGILRERSSWAYKELLALVRYGRDSGLDPLVMPGSIYGAIGLCQFMPSNLVPFGVDGNKDGKIDLFDPADAIPSVANYLRKHGWENTGEEARHKALRRYNKSTIYANTILALGKSLGGAEGGVKKAAPPAAKKGKKKESPEKTPAKKSAAPVKRPAAKSAAAQAASPAPSQKAPAKNGQGEKVPGTKAASPEGAGVALP